MTTELPIGRLTTVIFDRHDKVIYAGDDKGLIYRIAPDLSSFERSASTSQGVAIHAITADVDHVFTRDFAGNVARWSKRSLCPLDFIVSEHMTDGFFGEGATAVPSPSNALVCIDDVLLVANAYGTLSVLDRKTFSYCREIVATRGAFPEKINVEQRGKIIVSDIKGTMYLGKLQDTAFEPCEAVAAGAVHSIVLDRRFGRYWCTCDYSGNVFMLDLNGRQIHELQISNDDVEEIVLDRKADKAYVGCFDHYVHVLENAACPIEISAIGPFKFQINHLTMTDDGNLLVMLESGELHLVNVDTGKVLSQIGGTTAVWNMIIQGERLVTATEHGNIETFSLNSRRNMLTFAHHRSTPCHKVGRIRQVKLCDDSSLICGTTSGDVLRLRPDGERIWCTTTGGIVRDFAYDVNLGEIVVVNEIGELLLLDATTGAVRKQRKHSKPIWCVNFVEDNLIVFGERSLASSRNQPEPSYLRFVDRNTLEDVACLKRGGNHKRIRVLPEHRILVNGNGSIGSQIVYTRSFQVLAQFNDWVINTPENAVIHEGKLYAITYGYQLITYNLESGETVDVQFVTEGYPKALEIFVSPEGTAFLIAGGRNFLMSFLLGESGPQLVATRYLYDMQQPAQGAAVLDNPRPVSLSAPLRVRERTLAIA